MRNIRHAIKTEVSKRYENAVKLEHRGRFSAAERAWQELLQIPSELMPPHFYSEAMEFSNRKRLNSIRRIRMTVEYGASFLFLLFFFVESWMVWFPALADLDGWRTLLFIAPEDYSGPIELPDGIGILYTQLILFALTALIARSRFLHFTPKQLERYSSPPRMIALGSLIALSPLTMAIYELFNNWGYLNMHLSFFLHPAIILFVFFILCDLARGFRRQRIPANFALTLSWAAVLPFVLMAPRFGPDQVKRIELFYPPKAQLTDPFFWPKIAIAQYLIFLAIIIIEHIVYRMRHPEEFKKTESASITEASPSQLGLIRTTVNYESTGANRDE